MNIGVRKYNFAVRKQKYLESQIEEDSGYTPINPLKIRPNDFTQFSF